MPVTSFWSTLWASIAAIFLKMRKRLQRMLTGRGELERLLASVPSENVREIVAQFEAYVRRSDALKLHKAAILNSTGSEPRALAAHIVELKSFRVNRPDFHALVLPNLIALLSLTGHHGVVEQIASHLASTGYSSAERSHEELLRSLWTAAFPQVPLPDRVGPHWGDLGFQGKDPATDFRGAGLLGLQSLVHLARRYPTHVRHIIAGTELPFKGYPLAIAHIQVTNYALQLLRKRKLPLPEPPRVGHRAPSSMAAGEDPAGVLDGFLDVCAHMLLLLDDTWGTARAATVMDFPRVFATFSRELEASAIAAGGPVVLGLPRRLAADSLARLGSPLAVTAGAGMRRGSDASSTRPSAAYSTVHSVATTDSEELSSPVPRLDSGVQFQNPLYGASAGRG
jgi:hypothetical protein